MKKETKPYFTEVISMNLEEIANRVMEIVEGAEEDRGTNSLDLWKPDLQEFAELRIRMANLPQNELDTELIYYLDVRLNLLERSYDTLKDRWDSDEDH